MSNLKRSLFSGIVAIVLCISMLVGTTFAWFTDVATSGGNVIQTGNLELSMYWSENNADWKDAEGASAEPIFDYDKWEPGYTEVRYVKVKNDGSLAFKYQMFINPNGTVGKLAEVIDVSYDIVSGNASFVAPTETNKAGSLTTVGTLKELIKDNEAVAGGVLLPVNEIAAGYYSGEIVVCISLHMREDAGNTYQNSSIGTSFNIELHATQYSYESDSFGDQYDKDAAWPNGVMNFEVDADVAQIATVYGELANDLIIRYNSTVYALLPAGVKLADGVSSLKFSGKAVENGSNVTVENGSDAESYDIHIEGIADDNTTPITVYLGPILDKGISNTSLKLYHEDVQMTRVNSVDDFAINNQYTYNIMTGEVVIYVDNFSVFSAVNTTADEWDGTSDTTWYNENDTEFTLTTAEQLAGFRDLVDGGNTFAGKTVKLGVDIDLADKPFDPIGFGYYNAETNTRVFMGTFDGGKHTIYNLYENCWDLDPDKEKYSTYTYSTAGGGLFASIKDATIKNLAVSGADIIFECVDIGIVVGYAQGTCHFENIVVTDSKIANYNRATGGVVGEVCYGPYGTDVSKGYSHTFTNITVDSSVKISSLWGSFDTICGGVIGGKWGDATVKMTNVISAAELDVFSDVTSAYQWYAYRRCGMLIGHTEQSSPKKAESAAAPFLTCDSVKVYYGDWVGYTYYEYENQDSGTGRNYPWVRAEAGEHNEAFSNPRYGVPTHGGIKVTGLENSTDYTPIVFNQLYGGGQGVYGCANHDGVTVFNRVTNTVYIQNDLGWTDLVLDYWYVSGSDNWTTVSPDGIILTDSFTENGYEIYKIELPAFAMDFKIKAANDMSVELSVSFLSDKETLTLSGERLVNFTFGNDGAPGHEDGVADNAYTETLGKHVLDFDNSTNVFKNVLDEEGNSCIRLGKAGTVGTFTFTVPENVYEVIIYAAKYRTADSKINVNGIEYELAKNSDDGEYEEIRLYTVGTETVTVSTVAGYERCMIDSIVFISGHYDHDHIFEGQSTDPTCGEDGYTTYTCTECSKSFIQSGASATGVHSFENGACTVCGAIEEEVYTITYVLNGGTDNGGNPETYTAGSTTTLKNPTRDGYVFLGWYTDSGFKNNISKLTGKTGDLTLYAKWELSDEILTPPAE